MADLAFSRSGDQALSLAPRDRPIRKKWDRPSELSEDWRTSITPPGQAPLLSDLSDVNPVSIVRRNTSRELTVRHGMIPPGGSPAPSALASVP